MVGDSGFVAIPGSAIYSNYAEVRDMNKDMENMFATRTAALSVAEDALHTREEWFNRMLASLPDVAWTTSEDMRTIFISLNVEAMFGFSVAEIYANTAARK